MTKLKILEETIAYYSEDTSRRGYNTELGDCIYRLEREDKPNIYCAVGRCMNEHANFKFDGGIKNYAFKYFRHEQNSVDEHLLPQYQGHDVNFWQSIQNLHDTQTYWDEYGLTYDGKLEANLLRERYKNQ